MFAQSKKNRENNIMWVRWQEKQIV